MKEHLENYREKSTDTVAELEKSTYVDDLISEGAIVREVRTFQEAAIELFERTL